MGRLREWLRPMWPILAPNDPPVMRPPAPTRLVPLRGEDDLVALAKAEYVAGRIEAEELEAAIEHIAAGGCGTSEFPYLPVFTAGTMETIEQ